MDRLQPFPPGHGRNVTSHSYFPRMSNERFPMGREYFPKKTSLRRTRTFPPQQWNAHIRSIPNHARYNVNEVPLRFSPFSNPNRCFRSGYIHPNSTDDFSHRKADGRIKYLSSTPMFRQAANSKEMQNIPNYETFHDVSINNVFPVACNEQFPFPFKEEFQNTGCVQNISDDGKYCIPSTQNIFQMPYSAQVYETPSMITHESQNQDSDIPNYSSISQGTVVNSSITESNFTETKPLQTARNDTFVSHSHIQDVTQNEAISTELEEILNSTDENSLSVYFLEHLYPNLQHEDLSNELMSNNNLESAVPEKKEDQQIVLDISDSKNVTGKNSADVELNFIRNATETFSSNINSPVSQQEKNKHHSKMNENLNNNVTFSEEAEYLKVNCFENSTKSQDNCSEPKRLETNTLSQTLNLEECSNLDKKQPVSKYSEVGIENLVENNMNGKEEQLNKIPSNNSKSSDAVCFKKETRCADIMNATETSNSKNSPLTCDTNNEFHNTPISVSQPKFIFLSPVINISQQNQISTNNPVRCFDKSGNMLEKMKTENLADELSNCVAANVINFLNAFQRDSSTSFNAGHNSSEVECSSINSQRSQEKSVKIETISKEYDTTSSKTKLNSSIIEEVKQMPNEFEYSNVLNSETFLNNIESSLSSVTNYMLREPNNSTLNPLDNIFDSDNEEYSSTVCTVSVNSLEEKEMVEETSKTILEKCNHLPTYLPPNKSDNTGERLSYSNTAMNNDNSNKYLAKLLFCDAETQTLLQSDPDKSMNSFYKRDAQTQWNSSDAEYLSDNNGKYFTESLPNEINDETENNFRKYRKRSISDDGSRTSREKEIENKSNEIKCKQNESIVIDKNNKNIKIVPFRSDVNQNHVIINNSHRTINVSQSKVPETKSILTRSLMEKSDTTEKCPRPAQTIIKRKLDQNIQNIFQQNHSDFREEAIHFPKKTAENLVLCELRKKGKIEEVPNTHSCKTRYNLRNRSMTQVNFTKEV